MKLISRLLTCVSVLSMVSCTMKAPDILPPSSSVTRQEVVMTSRAYTELKWKPGKLNAFHGIDPSGIRVDTPDRDSNDQSTNYWVAGQWAYGMPYKWGGFDTPKEFMVKIQSSYHPALPRCPAGDMATTEKIRLGDDAVSPYAAGIDCSGFVSRCWRLDKPHSTRELPALGRKLDSYSELQTGDVLILPGVHVTLFLKWANAEKTRFIGSEAGSVKDWSVIERSYPLSMFREQGFVPMRYRNIK